MGTCAFIKGSAMTQATCYEISSSSHRRSSPFLVLVPLYTIYRLAEISMPKTNVTLPIRLPQEVYDRIRKEAYDRHLPLTAIIRQAIKEYQEKYAYRDNKMS